MIGCMYRERASALAGATLWSSSPGVGDPQPARILPDGCMDLIWSSRAGLLVAGPDTTAQLTSSRPGTRWVGLRLAPGAGPAVFGMPAYPLRDLRVPLDQIWPAGLVAELTDRLAGTGHPAAVLESVAADRLRGQGGPDPLAAAVVGRADANLDVAATAAELGLTARHLRRRCQALFGYGPKTLARIMRMRRALALVTSGVPAATAAVRAGYADQPHLCREVRALAGVPLGVLTRPAQPRAAKRSTELPSGSVTTA